MGAVGGGADHAVSATPTTYCPLLWVPMTADRAGVTGVIAPGVADRAGSRLGIGWAKALDRSCYDSSTTIYGLAFAWLGYHGIG